MQGLFAQLSALVGIILFINNLSSDAPLAQAFQLAIPTGLVLYLVLTVGSATITRLNREAKARPDQPTPAAEAPAPTTEPQPAA
ncbi:MAG: hypothetical protein RhofKO_01370 [Rhodothermales bacterium]